MTAASISSTDPYDSIIQRIQSKGNTDIDDNPPMPDLWANEIMKAYETETPSRASEIHLLFCTAIGQVRMMNGLLENVVEINEERSSQTNKKLSEACPFADGETALHVACRHGHDRIVNIILDAALRQKTLSKIINSRNGSVVLTNINRTSKTYAPWEIRPLHLAAENPKISSGCIRALLDAGADPLSIDLRGRYPITYAVWHNVHANSFDKTHTLLRAVTAFNFSPTVTTHKTALDLLKKRDVDVIIDACSNSLLAPLVALVADYWSYVYCPEYVNPFDPEYTRAPIDFACGTVEFMNIKEGKRRKMGENEKKYRKQICELLLEAGARKGDVGDLTLFQEAPKTTLAKKSSTLCAIL